MKKGKNLFCFARRSLSLGGLYFFNNGLLLYFIIPNLTITYKNLQPHCINTPSIYDLCQVFKVNKCINSLFKCLLYNYLLMEMKYR